MSNDLDFAVFGKTAVGQFNNNWRLIQKDPPRGRGPLLVCLVSAIASPQGAVAYLQSDGAWTFDKEGAWPIPFIPNYYCPAWVMWPVPPPPIDQPKWEFITKPILVADDTPDNPYTTIDLGIIRGPRQSGPPQVQNWPKHSLPIWGCSDNPVWSFSHDVDWADPYVDVRGVKWVFDIVAGEHRVAMGQPT